jgi:hypothetical protein
MTNHRLYAVAWTALILGFSMPANAKGPVVKLVVTGPDLIEPIEITDPAAIDVQVYGATFIDRQSDPIEDVPATPIPPYRVQFYVALGPDDVQMKYVVYYAWDSAKRSARVYFPGRHDPWWRHNVFTVALPFEGEWYYTTETWGQAVQTAIFDYNDPRELARSL